MVDFSPPFANGVPDYRRFPNVSERSSGFPCAGVDYTLFNGLEYASEAEINEVIVYAGLTPTNSDLTQLRQAITGMVADAIYGLDLPDDPPDPDLSDYVRLNLLRSVMPILPFVMNSTGRAGVYSPSAGYVRVPGGVWITHRGIYQFSTHETTFSVAANKTYHVRWRYVNGQSQYVLMDLADTSYNPGSLAEDNESFDTTYDDMLLARVVTTSSGSAQVTDLANKLSLFAKSQLNFQTTRSGWTTLPGTGISLNWARTPKLAEVGHRLWISNSGDVGYAYARPDVVGTLQSMGVRGTGANRYYTGDVQYNYFDNGAFNGRFHAEWVVEA